MAVHSQMASFGSVLLGVFGWVVLSNPSSFSNSQCPRSVPGKSGLGF